jgi:CubicO group peptidase (beta-lactamase class C family)
VVKCHGLAGLGLTVVRDGETVLHRGYGYSDLSSLSPVTPDTLYAIGSVSKQFTSFLLEYYQEHGLIDLELPLAPQLAAADQTFKITSG